MTTEETISDLRDTLEEHGYHVDYICGPDPGSWNELYRNCVCNFVVEKIVEEEYVIRVIDSWRTVIYPNGEVISCLPLSIENIVRSWSTRFAQAG
jgi:hypothetical protein